MIISNKDCGCSKKQTTKKKNPLTSRYWSKTGFEIFSCDQSNAHVVIKRRGIATKRTMHAAKHVWCHSFKICLGRIRCCHFPPKELFNLIYCTWLAGYDPLAQCCLSLFLLWCPQLHLVHARSVCPPGALWFLSQRLPREFAVPDSTPGTPRGPVALRTWSIRLFVWLRCHGNRGSSHVSQTENSGPSPSLELRNCSRQW